MPTPDGQYTEREWLEGLRYEDKFPDEGEVSGMGVIRHVTEETPVPREALDALRREYDTTPIPGRYVAWLERKYVLLAQQQQAVEAWRAKLDEMTLHDATGDPRDEGYMDAVREMRAFLDHPGGQ